MMTTDPPCFAATLVCEVVSIIMAAIMIYHIRSKYTAVGKKKKRNIGIVKKDIDVLLGRKEIVMFFYLFMLTTFFEMLLIPNIVPSSSPAYPVKSKKKGRHKTIDLPDIYSGLLLFISGYQVLRFGAYC